MGCGLFSDQPDLQGCCPRSACKGSGGFKYADAGRSLAGRQGGGKERKGEPSEAGWAE